MTHVTTATNLNASDLAAKTRFEEVKEQVLREYSTTEVERLALLWAARGDRKVSHIDCDVLTEYLWWTGAIEMVGIGPTFSAKSIQLALAERKECKSKATG